MRREKAALSSWGKSFPATAPVGSNLNGLLQCMSFFLAGFSDAGVKACILRVCGPGVREAPRHEVSEEIAGGAAGAMGIEAWRERCGAVIVRRG